MRQKYLHLLESVFIMLFLSFSMTSCEKENLTSTPLPTEPEEVSDGEPIKRAHNDQTIFMYFPWSSDLTSYFYQNISDIEKVIMQSDMKDERVIVFISTSPTKASLLELTCEDGRNVRKVIKLYTNPEYTKAAGITSILKDVRTYSPSDRYTMIIGCHGLGWIPVSAGVTTRSNNSELKKHWEYTDAPMTRFFGGQTSEYQTDITTLAQGISDAGMKMECILFDDCYMSTVEVAYDLKDVTDHLIASTSEILAYGMPYALIGSHLIGDIDYEGVCDGFYSFYSTYATPCGTIAVTDCSELDNLAAIMKEINRQYTFDSNENSSLQRLDGYSPTIFFDYGDYVAKLCADPDLLERFNEQLDRTIIAKRNTDYYFTQIKKSQQVKINTFSGITISDPSTNIWTSSKTETAWYKATH